ncbi:MAG: pyridoxamine kinase, partial [Sutterella sp. 54_7]
ILSNHTQYPEYSFLDLTDEMPKMIAGWKKLEIEFDAIYTGYLGSPRQIQIVSGFIDDFRREDTLIVVDPVLGDNGRLYAGMTKEMVIEMRVLARRADVLTPNLTEAAFLTGIPYQAECYSEEYIQSLVKGLAALGAPQIVLTGISFDETTCPYLPAHYPGTGDAFTSVVTGALLQGDSLPVALDRAAQFILQGIRATFGYQGDNREGILLERVLPNLNLPIQSSTYELL